MTLMKDAMSEMQRLQQHIEALDAENEKLRKELARHKPVELEITEPCLCRTREGEVIWVIAYSARCEEEWIYIDDPYYSNGRYYEDKENDRDIVEIIRPLTVVEMIEYCRTGKIDLGELK